MIVDVWYTLRSALERPELQLEHLTVNTEQLHIELVAKASEFGRVPVNANIDVTSVAPLHYEITPSQPGVNFDYDAAVTSVKEQWSTLTLPRLTLSAQQEAPQISESEATEAAEQFLKKALSEDLILMYTDKANKQYSWTISPSRLSDMIEVLEEVDIPYIGLSYNRVQSYLEYTVMPEVSVPAQDAKFQVDASGKVREFKTAQSGVELDIETTFNAMNNGFSGIDRFVSASGSERQSRTVSVAVQNIEPQITTASVNNLGITEILGTGTSNFAGSPKNRVHNIKNAVEKLNGVLVAPGTEFSTISSTLPYTLEGGYLPELVIKGDALKPEIGGGLCQVGSTLFRMAMNSGLPITERRNHSLAVSYYNDPSNGLPGTDATIYEPSPDFKFKNDTGNYILVQSFMDEKTGDLKFSLWGTSDGRKGSYTPPQVTKWYPAGEKRIIETTKLEPGKEECQKAFRGASASFTYTRELPDGTKDERVFESYYRPLPQICLVGVAAATEPCVPAEDGSTTCSASAPATAGKPEEAVPPTATSAETPVPTVQ